MANKTNVVAKFYPFIVACMLAVVTLLVVAAASAIADENGSSPAGQNSDQTIGVAPNKGSLGLTLSKGLRGASTVDSWEALKAAVEGASESDPAIITLDADITIPDEESLMIDGNKIVTIQGADGGVTIKRETLPKTGNSSQPTTDYSLEAMIKVESGTLTLGENLTFSGERGIRNEGENGNLNYWFKNDFKKGTRGFFVQVEKDGSLVIEGSTFENYSTTWSTGGNKDFIPAGISPLFVAGNFSMTSGTIQNNLAGSVLKMGDDVPSVKTCTDNSFLTHEDGNPAGLNGAGNVIASGSEWTVSQTTSGGIFFDAPDKELEITGGTITGNKGNAGGITVASGSLTIRGGEISNGFGDHFAGGLYIVSSDAEVRMCGGTIKNNESNMGGGVLPTNDATFFLMGGTIDGNKSYINGGGILVYSDNVYLLSGTIKNNASATFGGGVYVYGNDKDISQQYVLTLHNAEITGNEAVGTVTDSRIKGSDHAAGSNTSADTFLSGSGGGVWLCPAGVSEFDASTLNIYENRAVMQGDDFHKDAGFDGGVLLDFGPHDELDEWEHQELEGPKGAYVDSEKKKNHQKLTEAEATSGSNGSISLVHLDDTSNSANSLLRVVDNVSLRGGGIGSNGVVIFSKDAKDRNIDKGELEFEKTFISLPEGPMEFDMIAADDQGNPKKDSNGNDAVIMTFRLFDENYSNNYEALRVNPEAKEFGQFAAKWSDDFSKITIDFPEGKDDTNFFNGEKVVAGEEELKVIFREYEVNDDNKRGKQVSEQTFSYTAPEFDEEKVLINKEIKIYRGGSCAVASEQGCDEWSCDPGESETFTLRYLKYNFDTVAENRRPVEIEKYVNEAVHSDISLGDTFSYDILAYVPLDADEIVITDPLGADLQFAPTNGNVKVYDLGETVDGEGNKQYIDSNHLPVYDVSGQAIDNGGITPSVQAGSELDASTYTADTSNNTLTITIANKLETNSDGLLVNASDEQYATPLRGHYVRVHFDAQIAESVRAEIEAGTKTYSDLQNVSVDSTKEDTGRATPNVGNDPVVSAQDHNGIPNTASYVIKVKNEAKEHYRDTSNTVTVKPKEEEPVYLNEMASTVTKVWKDGGNTKDRAPVEFQLQRSLDGGSTWENVDGQVITLTEENTTDYLTWTGSFSNLPAFDENGSLLKYRVVEANAASFEGFYTYPDEEIVIVDVESSSPMGGTNQPNIPNTGVEISKQKVGGGPELEGAKLTVYKIEDGKRIEIETWTSGKEPHLLSALEPGIYVLREVTAPDGYEVAEEMTFRVNVDGTVELQQGDEWMSVEDHIVMFDAPKSVDKKPVVAKATGKATTKTADGMGGPITALFTLAVVAGIAGVIARRRVHR